MMQRTGKPSSLAVAVVYRDSTPAIRPRGQSAHTRSLLVTPLVIGPELGDFREKLVFEESPKG
jgi:hypothetical protein